MLSIENLKRIFCCLCILLTILILTPSRMEAKLLAKDGEDSSKPLRSLESLRDVDYQTWQLVVYPKVPSEGFLVLRIVGYPGTFRIDHPTALEVHAGLKDWLLEDITLSNSKLASDSRQAAAEFDLSPLVNDLNNNRPLRFKLPEVFNDLPIPPYVVSEWRTLLKENLINAKD